MNYEDFFYKFTVLIWKIVYIIVIEIIILIEIIGSIN